MPYRALIVDDSRSARMLLGRMLEGFGLSVHAVESAEQALAWLQDARPDVIFMDHLMPGMDGFAAVKVIKSDPQTANIPVLMYTSQEGELYLSQARALGALGVLPKTLKSADVASVLRQLNMLPNTPAATTVAAASAPINKPAAPTVAVEAPREPSSTTAQLAHRIAVELSAELPALKADLHAALRFWRGVVVAQCVVMAIGMGVLAYLQYQTHMALRAFTPVPTVTVSAAPVAPSSMSSLITSGSIASSAPPNLGTLIATESVNYGEVPLAGARLERLRTLVAEQRNKPGATVVKVSVFSADFCLAASGTPGGAYELAPEEWPVTRCELIGNPFGDALSVAQRQSAAFASFVNSLNNGQGRVVIQVQDGGRGTLAAYPERSEGTSAGRWNEAAVRNQRVEFSILTPS